MYVKNLPLVPCVLYVPGVGLAQSDFTFEEVTARGNAGTRLCRVTRSRPLNTLLDSAGVNSMRGLVLVTLVSEGPITAYAKNRNLGSLLVKASHCKMWLAF